MAKRVIQPSDREIAERARDLARQVSGRAFVSGDGIYLVRGRPDFRKLRDCLAGISEVPRESDAPTPMDLGFAPSQIAPLTHERLANWGRGLQKWRKVLNDYEKPRQKTAERRRKYQRWKEEIPRLSFTHGKLWQMLHRWEDGRSILGAPYVSDVTPETSSAAGAQFAEPLWAWLEGLVAWLAGLRAGKRFHDSLLPFAESRTARDNRRRFAQLLPRLRALESREDDVSSAELATAVREALASVPEELQSEFGLKPPKRPRDVHIASIVSACKKAAEGALPSPALVGSTAALCATDGATALLPHWLLALCDSKETEKRVEVLIGLFGERSEAGYGSLLAALSRMPNVSRRDLRPMRQFLVAGAGDEDVAWALDYLGWGARELSEKGLSPHAFRVLVSVLEGTGLKMRDMGLDDTGLNDVAEKVAERGSANIVEAFALWLSSLNPRALDANLGKWAWNCLCQLLVLEGASPALRSLLKRWADPPVSAEREAPLAAAASPETQVWLSKLHYYQKLCEQQPALPASVAKMLDRGAREARELEYLRGAKHSDELSERMAARLTLLESRAGGGTASEQRILKHVQEVCAHTALEAVKQLARREGRRVWAELIGAEPGEHLADDDVTAIAAWATGLNDKALGCLRELLAAWQESGADYRRRLPRNAAWVASADHLDLQAWFSPVPCDVDVQGLPVRICAAPDPFRILLMGSYFGTCLSLDDFNRDSVLANAYDANKAVVFVLDADGQVLGRKLLCVSSSWHLIGYRTYVAANQSVTKPRRECIAGLIDAFCGQWSRRMGLPLGFTGGAARLSGLFWYDDGVVPWSPGAVRSWTDPESSMEQAASRSGLMPEVAEALRTRQRECADMLAGLGIWPPDGEEDGDLAGLPALAEESLAVLARSSQDPQLAQLVHENATTPGGQLEAMTSLALLKRTDELVEHVFAVAKRSGDLAERAMEILRNVGSPTAWRLFMKLAVQERCSDPFWLPLAASDSDESTNALIEALLAPGDCEADHRQLILANEMLASCGKSLPQAAVLKALVSDWSGPRGSCYLAQWMPGCPDAVKRPNIARIARTDDCWVHAEQYATMTAVIAAMVNPGAKSTAYLRTTSEHEPSALLALSLDHGGRYRAFIRKTALATPAEPANILALVVSEGEDTATELLAPTFGEFPNQEARAARIGDLYKAFQHLDSGRTVSSFPTSAQSRDMLSTLPFVVDRLRRWTDATQPNIPALAALMSSEGAVELLRAHDVDLLGLATRMARLLGKADSESADALAGALRRLLDGDDALRRDQYVLLLGKLSRHRLWTDDASSSTAHVSVENALGCAGVWELLLDRDGNQRPVLKQTAWDSLWNIQLPMAPEQAARVVQLLPSLAPADKLAKEITTVTEIQKQLLSRHIPAADR